MKPVCSKVQLFQKPNLPQQMQRLNVFLLPNNVHLNEVTQMQTKYGNAFIETPSKCTLVTNKTYTVHCPQADFVQPEKDDFDLDYGPNYAPTFQIFLPSSTAFANVEVREENQTAVWKCRVPLPVALLPLDSVFKSSKSVRTGLMELRTDPEDMM
ncbi:hypothetical protein INR49_002771 [Caranx melampygus]|nr:hypothetical protein INR49_002771 [Caranx melampygus]